ncbi:AAA family ATPase [Stenotrophomonas rhizophila]|uniref:AAA family ATPase n=1 Tax=Stenotrophomonas rhizophila TaxID=216778 RepID=UPI001E37EF24|nr:AAA family ATPase [Stenotrophomonas rhizophila]MCC7635352.1 AAA family ATPase [Stenotrophomonas rhizophila]MCC7664419.1 AAA family ATPase [Stenotrophomonas rhizophila]
MKLVKARIRNFRSAEDTGTFDVGSLTCLVGKNEAGKTAVLSALYGVKPFGKKFAYDKVRDYPRRYLTRYAERHGGRDAEVATTTWELSPDDLASVAAVLGEGAVLDALLDITTHYGGHQTWSLQVDENKVRSTLLKQNGVEAQELAKFSKTPFANLLAEIEAQPEPSDALKAVKKQIGEFRDGRPVLAAIDALSTRLPVFFYTSHFDRMAGEVSLEKLTRDQRNDEPVSAGDQIFLDFLEYAGTSVDELENSTRLEELTAKCQAASNDITDEIFDFWSQNDALRVEIALAQGLSEDPAPFNSGTVAKIRIHNDNHKVSVPLSERSAGFVWFFSFLSQFKQMRKKTPGAIILLDEPGLTLHGKAQADLLRYIIERLLPDHQVIYSTHSPFMVPADRLADVRVVEDVVSYDQRHRATVKGTQVSADILTVDQDTLFPLQAHLGYEVTQSMFVGAHTLLVEGPSDVLFLQAASHALKQRNRNGLDRRWTICPTGGIDKVQSFASLFAGKGINIVALCDYGSGDKSKVQRLRASQILKSTGVLVATDFTGKDESDIEDFFAPALYAEILNGAYALKGKGRITAAQLSAGDASLRQVKQAESLFNVMDSSVPTFDHFSPASWLIQNQHVLTEDSAAVNETLDRFEKAFGEINAQLPADS